MPRCDPMTMPDPDRAPPRRSRGRPRGFEPHQALDAAVRVFWSEGYEGASVNRLSHRMRMPKASLYQAFGDKEGLFLAAVHRYGDTRLAPVAQAIGPNGSLYHDLSAFYEAVVTLGTADPATPGCLISCVLAEVAGTNPRFRAELSARFTALETRLHSRLVAGRSEVIGDSDPAVLAVMLASVARGMMVRARAGADRDMLQAVVRATVGLISRPAPVPGSV